MSGYKQLSRLTPCQRFDIRAPIWNGNQNRRMVGLDIRRIGTHNAIHFTYRRKSDGELSIPDTYYFDGTLQHQIDFDKMNVRGITLLLVPFEHLQILQRV